MTAKDLTIRIVVVLTLGLLLREKHIDLNIYDTYYVISYLSLSLILIKIINCHLLSVKAI